MRQSSLARRLPWFLGSAIVCAPLLVGFAGCGEDSSKQTVVTPEAPPADLAKDSMDFYKNNMAKGAPKKK